MSVLAPPMECEAKVLAGLSDEELVARLRLGHVRAFEELVNRYAHRIYSFCYRMLGNAQDAQDITQETFIRLLKTTPAGEDLQFSSWLYRVAKNLCIDEYRKRERGGRFDPGGEAKIERREDLSVRSNPEAAYRNARMQSLIEQTLASLPARSRTILVLREIEGLSYEEIGKVMDISRSAVESLLFRARRQFQRTYVSADIGSCEEIAVLISKRIDGEASDREAAMVEEHLSGCKACRRIETDLKTASRLCRGLMPVAPPAALVPAVMKQGAILLGASAALASASAAAPATAVGVAAIGALSAKAASTVGGKIGIGIIASLIAAGAVVGTVAEVASVQRMKKHRATVAASAASNRASTAIPHRGSGVSFSDAGDEGKSSGIGRTIGREWDGEEPGAGAVREEDGVEQDSGKDQEEESQDPRLKDARIPDPESDSSGSGEPDDSTTSEGPELQDEAPSGDSERAESVETPSHPNDGFEQQAPEDSGD